MINRMPPNRWDAQFGMLSLHGRRRPHCLGVTAGDVGQELSMGVMSLLHWGSNHRGPGRALL